MKPGISSLDICQNEFVYKVNTAQQLDFYCTALSSKTHVTYYICLETRLLLKEASGVPFETPFASVQVACLTTGEPDMSEMTLLNCINSLTACQQ